MRGILLHRAKVASDLHSDVLHAHLFHFIFEPAYLKRYVSNSQAPVEEEEEQVHREENWGMSQKVSQDTFNQFIKLLVR